MDLAIFVIDGNGIDGNGISVGEDVLSILFEKRM